MLEEHLTEEVVMEEVQKACDADFFEIHRDRLRAETKVCISLVLHLGIEGLNIACLSSSNVGSIAHHSLREGWVKHWWHVLKPGRSKAMQLLRQISLEDRIFQLVYQATHRLLDNEISIEGSH